MESKEFVNNCDSNNNLERSKGSIYDPVFPEGKFGHEDKFVHIPKIENNTQTQSNEGSLPVKFSNINSKDYAIRKNVEQQYKKRTSSTIIKKIIKGVILFVVGFVVLLFLWCYNNIFGGESSDVRKYF